MFLPEGVLSAGGMGDITIDAADPVRVLMGDVAADPTDSLYLENTRS